MTNPTKVIYGESGLLYIKSYLENISSEQDKYRDIFLLLEAALSRLVLLSAHLCSNCSHKFGRFWNEVQNDLEDAHVLFVKSQNSSHKPPTISEIRENDFHLKDNFMSNGEEYSNLYKADVNQYKITTKNTYNIFDAKFGEKDYNRTNSTNGSIKSMGYNHTQSQGSMSSYDNLGTLTPVKLNQNNVTPIIDIESPPPHAAFLGSPALRAMSYPGSGHSSSIPSPYASLGNNFEFKSYDNEDSDQAPLKSPAFKNIPLGIPDTPEHHGPFKDEPVTTRSVVADLIASQCVSRGGHSIVPASVLDIVFAANQGGTTRPDDGISPLLNACTAMASSSSDDEPSTENSLEDYLHGPGDEFVTSPTPLQTPLDRHPSDVPNDSTDREDSCYDLGPPHHPLPEAQNVGVGWEAAAVYGIARSPSVNSEATDDIFIEKEIIHGKIARIANLLKLPVYDLETPLTEEVDLVVDRPGLSPSPPTFKSSPKGRAERDSPCSSNIFETLEKFNERRRVQSLNQEEPGLEEEEKEDYDSDYEPRPSRAAHHKSAADKNVGNGQGLGQVGRRNKRKRKNNAQALFSTTITTSSSTSTVAASNRKKNAKR